MKKIVIAVIAGALVVCTASFAFPRTLSSTDCQVRMSLTARDITDYLENEGLTVIDTPIQNGSTWTCHTSKNNINYISTVYTEGNYIITHEDILI
jgi:hypothetical protein